MIQPARSTKKPSDSTDPSQARTSRRRDDQNLLLPLDLDLRTPAPAPKRAPTRSVSTGSPRYGALGRAVAKAVAEQESRREQSICEEALRVSNQRIGVLAHELRNLATVAIFAAEVIAPSDSEDGAPSHELLDRSLTDMLELIDRTLAE